MEFNYEKDFVDTSTGFLLRYIHSETERFVEHWHNYYEMFLILDGSTQHQINGTIQHLSEGAFVFIRPGDVHRYVCKEQCRFLNLAFSRETMNDLINFCGDGLDINRLIRSRLPLSVVLSKDRQQLLFRKFQQINTLEADNRSMFKFSMRVFLADIFLNYFSAPCMNENRSVPFWLEKLCDEMKDKENFVSGSNRMIQLSGKSREYVSRCMKKYYDSSITRFVNNQRLNYAANILMNSNMSVLDICYDSGYENVSYFHKQFKEKFGVSPKKYRMKQIQ